MSYRVSTPGRWCLLAGTATWAGVLFGLISPMLSAVFAVACLVAAAAVRRSLSTVAAVFLVAGVVSGGLAGMRTAAVAGADVPRGRVMLTARVAEEATARSYGRAVIEPRFLDGLEWDGPRLAVSGLDPEVRVGATVTIAGDLTPRVTRVRDELVAGVLQLDEMIEMEPPTNPIVLVGNAARERVTDLYDGLEPTDGLVRGLLIGDTDLLLASDEEDLRRAGLAHFIAVSGSNVAMFLVAWWFITAPIAVRPVLRVVSGIVGLAVFSVVTRWEPSVIRASVMAATLLVGGLVGIPLDPWMALGTAVTLLLLVSGHLAISVGFQLSVAATIGVLLGVAAASGRKPRWLYVPLLATVGAQITVAPIILVVFGTVPLAAPLANLIVGPMVTVTTAASALALIVPAVKPVADIGAGGILAVASAAASGPQLGLLGVSAVTAVGAAVVWPPTRSLGLAAITLTMMWTSATPSAWPTVPTIVVLDIGQGDAILLQDPSGFVVLIDGGGDARVLDRALRRNGVRRLDLVVFTHGDQDHVGGVIEILTAGGASELWVPEAAPDGALLTEAMAAAQRAGIRVREVAAGDRLSMSAMRVDVIGPTRRYLAENDGSVVLWVTADRTVFLGGDIGAIAQRDLPELRPDIMVVPHHGSGSTDRGWLARTVGQIAVLSYGENRYGHPHPDIVAVLDGTDVQVRRTYLEGDITIALSSPP
ncbi:MAG: hypothetical protein BMS9Abin12_1659 [Acidimicrobiia bacterium]|nr:MAG: hypothetical protein BMS9Abin12_1659 [Acidimicrobiia bacterium]